MKLTITLLPLLLAVPSFAIDTRMLVSLPSCVSAQDWQSTFTQLCPYFPPATAAGKYESVLYEPGDYQGQNKDSKAKVYCVFRAENGTQLMFTEPLVTQLGGCVG